MMGVRTARSLTSFLATLLSLTAVGTAHALVTYPGVAPCDATLQACIDGVTEDEVVQMVTNGPVEETITIGKSLTLEAGEGFTPTIFGIVFVLGGPTATSITIQRLTIYGWIEGEPGAGDFAVHLLDNSVILTSDIRKAILVQSAASPPYGDLSVEVARNTIAVAGNGSFRTCGGIFVLGPFDGGTSTVALTGNDVTVTGCGQGQGISVSNGRGDTLTADIVGNRVAVAETSDGILVRNFQSVPSTLDARIVNNVVTGERAVAYAPMGIYVLADSSQPITTQVINNTLVGRSLKLHARTDLGGSVTGVVANNIVVYPDGAGVSTGAVEPAVTNDHNLVFDNPNLDDPVDFTPGPGTMTQNPLFVSSSDFHLQAASPAIDAGNNARLPIGTDVDADGEPRIVPAGGTVDIGAYENQDVTNTTATTSTTSTTLPAACSEGTTFPSIVCRFDALMAEVEDGVPSGTLQVKLGRLLDKAQVKLGAAKTAGGGPKATRALGKASGRLAKFVARLGSRKAQHAIDASVRAELTAHAIALQADVQALRDSLG